MSCDLNDIMYFAVNVMDLTRLNPAELMMVNNKISLRQIVRVNKNKIDGDAVILQSTIKNDYMGSFKNRQNIQLKATCELLWDYLKVRTYFSKNGKTFHQFKF